MWALPQGECGHAKGITDASPTIFKPKPRKGEEGGPDTATRWGRGGEGAAWWEATHAHALSSGVTVAREWQGCVVLRC
jgi:hypothetical protein